MSHAETAPSSPTAACGQGAGDAGFGFAGDLVGATAEHQLVVTRHAAKSLLQTALDLLGDAFHPILVHRGLPSLMRFVALLFPERWMKP